MKAHRDPPSWLNPEMLKWARLWRGRTVSEAADKLKKSPETVANWENGIGSPTVRQARTLAAYYGRSFIEFFLPEPLDQPLRSLVPDFRLEPNLKFPEDTWEVRQVQHWAATQRENALDLFSEIGDEPPNLPAEMRAQLTDDPEVIAVTVRRMLGFPIEEQQGLDISDAGELAAFLRARFEGAGILTLRASELNALGIRGICLAEFPLPVIVFRSEAPSAQSFTLAHELGHIILRQSAISGGSTGRTDRQPVENWCNRFAGAFLVPKEALIAEIGRAPVTPATMFPDQALRPLSRRFRVSEHAMLVRLVQLGYVHQNYYWDTKRPQFDAEDHDYRSFGRPKYYGSRYASRLGGLYTHLVLDAWGQGRITNHNAAEYMGIKNIAHLYDIRDHFTQQ